MSKVEWGGGALLSPLPAVMVSSARDGEAPNVATVAWCGMICTQPPRVAISLRPSRYSHEIISQTREFVINLVPASLVAACDTCGVYTGRKVDKFKKCSLTPEKSKKVACPSIEQSPLTLECRVFDILPQGSHDLFLADVVAVGVEENLIDEKGALHLEKASLVAYSHGTYFELGKKLGTFGYSVRKKRKSPAGAARSQTAKKRSR